jgi:hypothetical protein
MADYKFIVANQPPSGRIFDTLEDAVKCGEEMCSGLNAPRDVVVARLVAVVHRPNKCTVDYMEEDSGTEMKWPEAGSVEPAESTREPWAHSVIKRPIPPVDPDLPAPVPATADPIGFVKEDFEYPRRATPSIKAEPDCPLCDAGVPLKKVATIIRVNPDWKDAVDLSRKFRLRIADRDGAPQLIPHKDWEPHNSHKVFCPFTGKPFLMITRHFRALGYSVQRVRKLFNLTEKELPTAASRYRNLKKRQGGTRKKGKKR